MIYIYASSSLAEFEQQYNANDNIETTLNSDAIGIHRVWMILCICIVLMILYVLIMMTMNTNYAYAICNKLYMSIGAVIIILGGTHIVYIYTKLNGGINNINNQIESSIQTAKNQIKEYSDKNTILPGNNIPNELGPTLSHENIQLLIQKRNATYNIIQNSMTLADQYINYRNTQINSGGINSSSIEAVIDSLYNECSLSYNNLINTQNLLTNYINQINVTNINAYNAKMGVLNNKYSAYNNSDNLTTLGNISKTFLDTNKATTMRMAKKFFIYQCMMHQHHLPIMGMPYILDNDFYISPMGKTIRADSNDNFVNMSLKNNDTIYMSQSSLSNTASLFNNNSEVSNAIFNKHFVVSSIEKKIYENNELIMDTSNMLSFQDILYKNFNNNVHIVFDNIRIKYDTSQDSVLLSYTAPTTTGHKCIMFRRYDILDFPGRYINYNLNQIESYNYDITTNKLYLTSKPIPHEYNTHIWNLFSETFDSNTRITYAKIPSGNNITCNFMTISNIAIGISLNLTYDSNIIFIEKNSQYYVIVLNPYNKSIYKLNNSGTQTYIPNSAPNMFTIHLKEFGQNTLSNIPNSTTNQDQILKAFTNVSLQQTLYLNNPTHIYTTSTQEVAI